MRRCSVVENLEIVKGDTRDIAGLERYHYRAEKLRAFAAVFALRANKRLAKGTGTETVGVIVYTMPAVSVAMRNIVLGEVLSGLDRKDRLNVINKNIRCISRVIIEPRFRGLGLAVKLVKETMGLMDVAVIEAMAVMGRVNPFFERAGMRAYRPGESAQVCQLKEAFSLVGVEEDELIDARAVEERLERLGARQRRFIEGQIEGFLQGYGKRRFMKKSIERTGYVLSRLGERPIYYIWINEKLRLRI